MLAHRHHTKMSFRSSWPTTFFTDSPGKLHSLGSHWAVPSVALFGCLCVPAEESRCSQEVPGPPWLLGLLRGLSRRASVEGAFLSSCRRGLQGDAWASSADNRRKAALFGTPCSLLSSFSPHHCPVCAKVSGPSA